MQTCPICLNAYDTAATFGTGTWGYRIKCPICGTFDLDRETYYDYLDAENPLAQNLSKLNRARIAHKIRTAQVLGPTGHPKLTSDFLERYIADGSPGPSPGQQAINAIKFIGAEIEKTGERIEQFPPSFFAIIGSANPDFAADILFDLKVQGLVDGYEMNGIGEIPQLISAKLTLAGWEKYEAEKQGQISTNYGFMAMKFGDPALEPIVSSVIKPSIKSVLNYDVFDMRDVARAGVIDNIMRAQIRDAAFVIVDLTHDNAGAYWEAGYAEGLGKPVIYICEKSKFDSAKTHFDTNHCTTVVWVDTELEIFKEQLIATIRRSLNIFPSS